MGSSTCFAGICPQQSAEADVLVVGAGPAGISAVLALQLQKRRIFWVDPAFQSGRLARYLTVPCNTKVDILAGDRNFRHPLLQPVASCVTPALQKLIAEAEPLAESTDPSELGWTTLGSCKHIYDAVTTGLSHAGGVSRCFGKVTRLTRVGSHWVAAVDAAGSRTSVKVQCVVLATGAEPKAAPLPNAMSAETTFDEALLRQRLRPNQRLAVLGNSHTAAVALAKLSELAGPMSLSITCFSRRPLRCAEWLEDSNVYRYNSTGLKGFGAVFGRKYMVHGTSWLEIKHIKEFLPEEWDWVIDCTGYVKSQLPTIDGVKAQELPRDEVSGALLGAPPGVFALGVPWGEAPGRLWGQGREAEDGFRGEDTFVGFAMFFARAGLIADEIHQVLECKQAA
ncbi:AgnR1 [Symbiodinium natans]|uniref:AgnR1 protein n=1 Tax=Symbiodinium natans TaxID=878477 RepID=A0A812KL58_9DINO|nr:AgnR1 [Symbiodinium natans]